MAHSVRRVNAQGVREGSMLYWCWKNINRLIASFEWHLHNAVTAGGSSTGTWNGEQGMHLADWNGKSPSTGATVPNTNPGGVPRRMDMVTSGPGGLLAELIEAWNQFMLQVDGH